MKFFRIAFKTLMWLAFGLLALIAIGPWVIGSAGGSGAGMVAFGLLWFGGIYGVPIAAGLLALGGAGLLLTNRLEQGK